MCKSEDRQITAKKQFGGEEALWRGGITQLQTFIKSLAFPVAAKLGRIREDRTLPYELKCKTASCGLMCIHIQHSAFLKRGGGERTNYLPADINFLV